MRVQEWSVGFGISEELRCGNCVVRTALFELRCLNCVVYSYPLLPVLTCSYPLLPFLLRPFSCYPLQAFRFAQRLSTSIRGIFRFGINRHNKFFFESYRLHRFERKNEPRRITTPAISELFRAEKI